jgi:DinB superfamily
MVNDELQDLKDDLHAMANDARNEFGKLTVEQLNWKPAPDRWSVAQCFDHLVTGNAAYFPIFDSLISGQKQPTVVERLPLFPKVWGKLLIKSLDPKTTRKMKAPAGFQPSSSDIPGSIIDDFVTQQGRVSESIDATRKLEPERIVITSPAASLITYSLMDAFRIIVVHEKRHFQQAQRVTQELTFPK